MKTQKHQKETIFTTQKDTFKLIIENLRAYFLEKNKNVLKNLNILNQ